MARSPAILLGLLALSALPAPSLQAQGGPLRVQPVGDSITVGAPVPGGYRTRLYDLMSQAGAPIDFVGPLQSNPDPGSLPDPDHDGYGGYTIEEIGHGWQPTGGYFPIHQRVDTYLPDALLLLAGVNDLGPSAGLAPWYLASNRMDDLVEVAMRRPAAPTVVLATLTPSLYDPLNLMIESYNRELVELVRDRHAAGDPIMFVDMHAAVPQTEIADLGLHPTPAGYDLMADAWSTALLNLGAAPVLPPPPGPVIGPMDGFASDSAAGSAPRHAVNRSGLAQGLRGSIFHDADKAVGANTWTSGLHDWVGNVGEYMAPADQVWFAARLDRRYDIESFQVWNGRTLSAPYDNLECARDVEVLTSEDGQTWTSRGLFRFRPAPDDRAHPGEVFAVDWPGVRYVAYDIQDCWQEITAATPPGSFAVSFAEFLFRGTPTP